MIRGNRGKQAVVQKKKPVVPGGGGTGGPHTPGVGTSHVLTATNPPWYSGVGVQLPLLFDKPVSSVTKLSALSGSEWTLGASGNGQRALFHAGGTAGSDHPCQLTVNYTDSTSETITISPNFNQMPATKAVKFYYGPWRLGLMPPAAIDYTRLTHIIMFSLHYGSDFEPADHYAFAAWLDQSSPEAALAMCIDMRQRCDAAGAKFLLSVGGQWRTSRCIEKISTEAGRVEFTTDMMNYLAASGAHGLDINFEGDVTFRDGTSVPATTHIPWIIDTLKKLRAAWTGSTPLILTSPSGGNTNSNGDYHADPVWNVFVPALSTHLDDFDNQTYSGPNNFGGWTLWGMSCVHGGAGSQSIGATTWGMPFTDPAAPYNADYSSHPESIDFAIAARAWTGVAKCKQTLGMPFYTAFRGPNVFNPGDPLVDGNGVGLTDYGWGDDSTPDYWWYESNVKGRGTVVFDTAAQFTYVRINPAQTVQYGGVNKNVSYVVIEDKNSFKAKGDFIEAQGMRGGIIWLINDAPVYHAQECFSRIAKNVDDVPDEFTLTPVTGATVSTYYETPEIQALGINIPTKLSGGTGAQWRKRTAGGTMPAYGSVDTTVNNTDYVQWRVMASALGGIPTTVDCILGNWIKSFTVTTAVSGTDPINMANMAAVWELANPTDVFADFAMSSQSAVGGVAYSIRDRKGTYHIQAPSGWPQGATTLKTDANGLRYLDLDSSLQQALYTAVGVPGAINGNTRLPANQLYVIGVGKKANADNGPLFDWTTQASATGVALFGPGYKSTSGIGGYCGGTIPYPASPSTDLNPTTTPNGTSDPVGSPFGVIAVGQNVVIALVNSPARGKRQLWINKTLVWQDSTPTTIPDFPNNSIVQLAKLGFTFGNFRFYCMYCAFNASAFPLTNANWDLLHTRAGSLMGLTL
jgi:GH18 family chitinase